MTPQNDPTIPFGFCQCGCGQKTSLASVTNAKRGWIRGMPLKMIRGHNRRGVSALSKSRSYGPWCAMKQRCLNPKHTHFSNYGGRGITICERWLSFEYFLEDMGERPEGMTLERKENSGNYNVENCIWASRKQQNNNSRWNRIVRWNGKNYTVAQLAELSGIQAATIYYRLNRGWSIAKVLSTPVGYRNAI